MRSSPVCVTGWPRGQSAGRGPCRTLHVFDQSTKAIPLRVPNPDRRIKTCSAISVMPLSNAPPPVITTPLESCLSQPALSDLVGNVHQDFFRTRLQDVAKDLTRKLPRRAAAHRRNIHQLAPLHLRKGGAARSRRFV